MAKKNKLKQQTNRSQSLNSLDELKAFRDDYQVNVKPVVKKEPTFEELLGKGRNDNMSVLSKNKRRVSNANKTRVSVFEEDEDYYDDE